MSTRRLARVDDGSLRYRDSRGIPTSVPRRSRETIRASQTPETTEVSARGRALTGSPTPQLRNESVHTRTSNRSDAQLPRDTQKSAKVERGSIETRRRAATPASKDQVSIHSESKEVGIQSRDTAMQSKEEDRVRYDGDRTGDTMRTIRYPSSRENVDIGHPLPARAKDTEPSVSLTPSLQYLLEAKSRQINYLEDALRMSRKDYKTLVDSYTELKQVSEEREKVLDSTRHEHQAALERMNGAQNAHAALRQQHDELTKKFNIVRHELKTAREQKQRAEEACANVAQKYEAQKNEHHALCNRHQSLKAALEQRTSELQGVQKFLSTADTFSGSEVVNTLRKLNEEVNQNATFMAEWSIENLAFETLDADQLRTPTETTESTRASDILGTALLERLGKMKNQDNPIFVEMVFRAYLITELYWIASPWGVAQEEQSLNQCVDAIYQRMRETEGQAVSGNWRALTRAYTLPACIGNPELAHNLAASIVSGLSAILLVAGCAMSKEDIGAAIWSKFAERIHHFISLAGQVNKIVGVGVISEDFEVLVVFPGVVFDEKTMDNADDNGERMPKEEELQETVLCVTELGLKQRMMVGGSAGDKTRMSELILIKPKVTLASVLSELTD